jgi:O-antigen ligase
LLVVWSLARFVDRSAAVPAGKLGWIGLAALLPLAWAGLQVSPWTPAAFHHPLWSEAARVTGAPIDGRITVDPAATRAGLARLGLYVAVGFLAVQLARDRRRAAALAGAVAVGAVASAAAGLADALTRNHLLPAIPDQAWVTGTFVSRNHFATLAGLGLLAAVALATRPLRGALSDPAGPRGRLLNVAHAVFGSNGAVWCAGALLLVALLMSGSRAGVAASVAGLCVLVAGLARAGRVGPRRAGAAVAACLGVVTGFLALVGTETADRVTQSVGQFEGRRLAYMATLQAIRDRPLLGTGLGTFQDVFPAYQPAELENTFQNAHNTYLENGLELGVPAAVLLALAPAAAARQCWRGLRRRRRDQHYPALALAATALVGLHATLDSSLEMPGVTLPYVILLATGVAQSFPTAGNGSPVGPPGGPGRSKPRSRATSRPR